MGHLLLDSFQPISSHQISARRRSNQPRLQERRRKENIYLLAYFITISVLPFLREKRSQMLFTQGLLKNQILNYKYPQKLMNTDKQAISQSQSFPSFNQKRLEMKQRVGQSYDKLIPYLNSIQNMWRKKQLANITKQKLQVFTKENHFCRDTIPDLIKLLRSSNYQSLKQSIQSHTQIMDCVKWLILVHNLILVQPKLKEKQIIQLLQTINAQSSSNTTLQTILLEKMIFPYKGYLLKRNSFSLREIDSQFHCFVLINLIKTALSFTNILFTIGRYLLKNNNFLVQFNIVIAKDLSHIYQVLDQKMDDHFRNQNAQIIQRLNENMYNIFYNCYFNRFVSCFAPDWIDTDIIEPKSANQIRINILTPKVQFRTQKLLETLHTQCQNEFSITMEESNMQLKPQLKSTSTIASNRESEDSEDADSLRKEKEIRERKEFIFMAESILEAFKEQELEDQVI